jgi:hypothetical protein
MANVFYSTIADRSRKGTFDALTELKDYTDSAISATTAETGIEFPVRKTQDYKVCLSFATYSGYVATTAEWVITVEVSDVVGGTYTPVASYTPKGTAEETEICLSGVMVSSADADAEFIRVKATKTGVPGNLTYGAYIVPC